MTEATAPEATAPVIRLQLVSGKHGHHDPEHGHFARLYEIHAAGTRVGTVAMRDREGRMWESERIQAVREVLETWAGVHGENPRYSLATIVAAAADARDYRKGEQP